MGSLNGSHISGKVFVKGKASEEFICDMVTITITFHHKELSGAKASQETTKQCEQFLKRLAESGVDIAMLRLHNDSIDRRSYSDEEEVNASRTIQFDSQASATTVNFILKIIQDELLDAEFSTEYYLSNEEELRK